MPIVCAIVIVTCTLWVSSGCSPRRESTVPSVRAISQEEVLELRRSGAGPLLLDVRTEAEYRDGHVAGALNIPHTEIAARLAELEEERLFSGE